VSSPRWSGVIHNRFHRVRRTPGVTVEIAPLERTAIETAHAGGRYLRGVFDTGETDAEFLDHASQARTGRPKRN